MKKNQKISLAFLGLLLLLLFMVVYFSSGCVTSKGKVYSLSDSTNLKSLNVKDSSSKESASVKKDSSRKVEDLEYWRKIIEYGNAKPDTNITNNNYYTTPTRVILEGGKSRTEESSWSLDSSTFKAFTLFMLAQSDSTNARLERMEKVKKSNSLGFGFFLTIALVGLGLMLLNKGLSFFGNNYTITKKKL